MTAQGQLRSKLRSKLRLRTTLFLIVIFLFSLFPTVAMAAGTPGQDTIKVDDYVYDYNNASNGIQAAIDTAQAQHKKLVFSPRVYTVNRTVLLPSDVDIDFNYATIKRQSGKYVFDLLKNADPVNGNSGIKLANLYIDGNKDADGLVAPNPKHRFSGLALYKVRDSRLENITVTGTVNAEDRAGIYFENSKNVDAYQINGYKNDRTAILLNRSKVRIFGSKTYDNWGSGISSLFAHESEYYDIVSYNNGYSNISINGKRSKASNILTYGSSMSGLNIGHSGDPADGTKVTNVRSFNNTFEGLTVADSSNVDASALEIYDNKRNNIRIFAEAKSSRISKVISRDSAGGQGILYESGTGHILENAEVYRNANSGIYVDRNVSLSIGGKTKSYNNGQIFSVNSAGIVLNQAVNAKISGLETYDNQRVKTQESGLWIASGSGHVIKVNNHDNKKYNQRTTGKPKNVKFK